MTLLNHSALARKVEAEILDEYFKRFKLLSYSSDYSIPFLLKAYGDFERHWGNVSAPFFRQLLLE